MSTHSIANHGRPRGSLSDSLWVREQHRFRRQLLEQYLVAFDDNRSKAARALGISRAQLHMWIRRYGVAS
jgi:transcriptional regulator with GAF, ATPase, and Fis domain